ncbi:Cof-type HAD-IIB family hydrolase [Acetobacteraceae bacterium KSS8]|uniref:Cof-type HAD-IIB family hydrolase n=1 Tax=Endosaccharibacter trunci TaxID=2812733 RepID=A0ABT1W700_9PROT|nr:Cof-type HAD-IIB family hydrolase [Acetobacteraceae bacterium KSS8]
MSTGAIRLLVSDIDGTLIGSDKRLAPATVEAARALGRAGIRLCLASSRSVDGMRQYLDALGVDTPAAGLNGGEILAADGSVLDRRNLDPEVAQLTLETLERHGIESWVFTGTEWLVADAAGPFVPREQAAVKIDPIEVPSFAPYLDRVGKIMGATTDYPLLERVEIQLGAMFGERVNAHRSSPWYLDVTHPDANKGAAAMRLARLLGIDPAEMACIGDMDNDISMLQVAGLSIAMGNAPQHVQAAAQYVTAGNNEDGWAKAVNTLVLPRAPGRTNGV